MNKKKIAKKLIALLLVCMITATVAACGNGKTTNDPNTSQEASSAPGGDSSSAPAGGNSPAPGGSSTAPGGNSPAPGGDSGSASAKDTLNYAVGLDSGTLDPMGITGSGGFLGVAATYCEPIFDNLPDGGRRWLLVTGIDPVSDLQYTYHIRPGVTFSNGNPLTADDILFTFRLYGTEPSRALNVQSLDLEKSNVIDEYTLDLWYSEFNAAQESMLSAILIVDAESFDPQVMATNPVGTGPYEVIDYVPNSHVAMRAREDYWGGKPAIEYLNYLVFNESSQITNALETGAVDIATVPPSDVAYIEGLGTFNLRSLLSVMCISAYYNMAEGALLASKEARYAVSHAIDIESIINVAYNGYASATDWPASKGCVDYEARFGKLADIYADSYNLDKARQYAEQAGLVGKTLTLITNGADAYVTIAQIMQNDLSEIGVNLDIRNYDQASYYGLISDVSNYDIALYFIASPNNMAVDQLASYLLFFNCGWSGPEREEYMALARSAVGIADPAARSDKLLEAVTMLVDYNPWYSFCDTQNITAFSNKLQDITTNISGRAFLEDLYFVP